MPWNTPTRLRRACLRRDDYTCQQCGYQSEPNSGELHVDHIHNRAEGGADVLDNLVTLCVPCHQPKTQAEAARGRWRRSGKRRSPLHPADALG
ncbi:hypothetical protein MMAN_04540 [Mycobacterium mantenii]|nr:HNH endonuclease [Mycobacterium mantenii]MCV7241184.1 HNH endonuclease [Mycobacterium mantenii]BBY36320.1 hypothetical protein MMAN_04540 [Mycobacterium mantenii]